MSEMDAYIETAIDQFRSGKRRSGDKTICQGIERVIAAIAKEMHGSESSSISHLVHYTGMDVVFAMLNDGDDKDGLRLYDTVHANDPEEGRFLLLHWPNGDDEHFWMWQQGENSWPGDGEALSFKQQVERGLYPGHAYVLSFVPSAREKKNNDRIVFWREYGRHGAGCSISIPKNKLSADERCSLAPYRVRYGQADVRNLADKLNIEPLKLVLDTKGLTFSLDCCLQRRSFRRQFPPQLEGNFGQAAVGLGYRFEQVLSFVFGHAIQDLLLRLNGAAGCTSLRWCCRYPACA